MSTQQGLPENCFHGGASFEAIGYKFERLDVAEQVINADVLDAWFPPAPEVVSALAEHLAWILRTSPPTDCDGLVESIAASRGIPADSVMVGGGSSSLLFLALPSWLKPSSRVLILDPSYGEYAHILENVIGCHVDRFALNREDGFQVDLEALSTAIRVGYDLVVLVNPNNPTGRNIPRGELEELVSDVPPETRVWVDETYVDFVNPEQSLERLASCSQNVVVCKSMSKVYALSGVRVGYLCGPRSLIGPLRRLNPPWAVSLPGQFAAVTALQYPEYYHQKYQETRVLREQLARDLQRSGNLEVIPGTANFLFCELSLGAPPAELVLTRCRERDLFLRDPAATSPRLGQRSLRIAVKDAATNRTMVDILGEAMVG